jgi:hypothetical protein
MTASSIACVATVLLATACADRRDAPSPPDDAPAPGAAPAVDSAPHGWTGRPGEMLVFHDTRAVDFTGDGAPEQVLVAARGPTYDELGISLVIRTANADSLWVDRWESTSYFKYIPRDSLADSTAARIVRGHVDALLADSMFHDRGVPHRVVTDIASLDRAALQYHLAELDWRAAADLEPRDPTPAEGHQRIRADAVSRDRVEAVLRETATHPTFMYYGGGEVTTLLGWSEREHAFVRLFHCC